MFFPKIKNNFQVLTFLYWILYNSTPVRRDMAVHMGISHDKLRGLYAEAIADNQNTEWNNSVVSMNPLFSNIKICMSPKI